MEKCEGCKKGEVGGVMEGLAICKEMMGCDCYGFIPRFLRQVVSENCENFGVCA